MEFGKEGKIKFKIKVVIL